MITRYFALIALFYTTFLSYGYNPEEQKKRDLFYSMIEIALHRTGNLIWQNVQRQEKPHKMAQKLFDIYSSILRDRFYASYSDSIEIAELFSRTADAFYELLSALKNLLDDKEVRSNLSEEFKQHAELILQKTNFRAIRPLAPHDDLDEFIIDDGITSDITHLPIENECNLVKDEKTKGLLSFIYAILWTKTCGCYIQFLLRYIVHRAERIGYSIIVPAAEFN